MPRIFTKNADLCLRHAVCSYNGMVASKKKIIIISLVSVLLCCGIKLAGKGTYESDTKALMSACEDDPNLTIGSNSIGVGGLFYKMILMVLVVIALGVAVIFLSKKLLPKLNLAGKRIKVIEAVHLGPKKSLHLIKIGKKTLLIGSTNENITNLADVTDQLSEVDLSGIQMDDN